MILFGGSGLESTSAATAKAQDEEFDYAFDNGVRQVCCLCCIHSILECSSIQSLPCCKTHCQQHTIFRYAVHQSAQVPAHARLLHTTVCMSVDCAFQVVVPLLLCCLSSAFAALHVLHNCIVCASASWHFHGPPWQLLQFFDHYYHPDHPGSYCHFHAQVLAIFVGCNISACVQASASFSASHLCVASRPPWQLSRGF